MNIQKKNHPHHEKVSSLIKMIILAFYTILAVLSILHHNINSIDSLIIELIVYTVLGLGLYTIIDNISLKSLKEGLKVLFD